MLITPEIESLIERALAEDLSIGDPTTETLIPQDLMGAAKIVSRAAGVLAGLDVGLAVFKRLDPQLETSALARDGARLSPGDEVAVIRGRTSSILQAERTAINFIQRLSGVATETARYVEAIKGHKARIIDTRKTTPGLRALEKYAVRAGGGYNHRRNLGDGILIKDNHIQALSSLEMSLGDIVRRAREGASHTINVEVEVEDLDQLKEALDAGAGLVLLDNMPPALMAEAVNMARGRAVTEASGGIDLDSVREVAATGVDLISVGALTHSSKALNLSLDLVG